MGYIRYLDWLTRETQSIYWHDSAIAGEAETAFSNGAVGMTTNPYLCSVTLYNDPEHWRDIIKDIPKSLKGDEKAEELIKSVTLYYAKRLRPVYDIGKYGHGYVCAQTNPYNIGDAEALIEQAKRISKWAPNICIKLPATSAGLCAFEECTAYGFNVTATISFTVSQALVFAEAHKRGADRARRNGIKPGLATIVVMLGRLDEYLHDVAHDHRKNISDEDIRKAGIACFKKAYQIFNENKYEAILMPASFRSAYQVKALSGARAIMSLAPNIANLLADESQPFLEQIEQPIDKKTIDTLLTMDEFRKAYLEYAMKAEDFITYGSTNRTVTQFIECGWKLLQNYNI